MANEFIHKDVGSRLSETEYDSVGAHGFNSQATGDIMYASSATQLSRLGITNDRILISSGGVPAWSNTLPAFTLSGTVTLDGQAFDAGSGDAQVNTTGEGKGIIAKSTQGGASGAVFLGIHDSATPANSDILTMLEGRGDDDGGTERRYGYFAIQIEDVQAASYASKMKWVTRLATAWNNAMTLSGAGELWVDTFVNPDDGVKVAGTQVVGARVIDARVDDAINSGDATTDGVIDALRDAMVTHGLIAAA